MKDFEIRRSLHQNYLKSYYHTTNSIVVNELKVCNGNAIMDVAVINGSLIGFEIKSSSDNLVRLGNQIIHYNKVFDYVTLVTNYKHVQGALREIPPWWGVWVIEKANNILSKYQIQEAAPNVKIESFSIAQFLWKNEIKDLITRRKLDQRICRKRKWVQWQYLSDSIDPRDLKKEVSFYLRSRSDWKTQELKLLQ